YLTGQEKIKGLGAVSVSAPLPIVFSTVNGLETFPQEFVIALESESGETYYEKVTAENYSAFKAPYNLRNVYGFSMAYGPAVTDAKMLMARDQILDFAFCSDVSSMRKVFPHITQVKNWKIDVTSRALANQRTLLLEGTC